MTAATAIRVLKYLDFHGAEFRQVDHYSIDTAGPGGAGVRFRGARGPGSESGNIDHTRRTPESEFVDRHKRKN